MAKKYLVKFVTFLVFVSAIWGCKNSKQLAYFQDLNDSLHVQNIYNYPYKPLRLQAEDQVQIIISSTSPEASQFFNLAVSTVAASVAGNLGTPANAIMNVYSVSTKGNITMPVFGDIYVQGFTTEELKDHIGKLLQPYLKDGVVSVRLVNFKVTVIGDVNKPMVVPVAGEKINILEAIGYSGDISVFGKKTNVRVIRHNGDSLSVQHLNFTNSKIFQSPYFQLRQNDVVYIEPVKSKAIRTETALILVPVLASIATLLVGIFTRL